MSAVSTADAVRALQRIDWNFARSKTPASSVHTLHWFPGNFIPQIPRFLIEILTQPGDLVVDPFCGSGTTGVEASSLGRISHQSDVNPASIQVTVGKIAVLCEPDAEPGLQAVLEQLLWDFVPRELPARSEHGSDPELRRWIHEETLHQLQLIWSVISGTRSHLRSMLTMIFSDTLFRCASPGVALTRTGGRRRHHWGWIADNVRPKVPRRHNALELFRDRLTHLVKIVRSLQVDFAAPAKVSQADARNLGLPDDSVDAIVTSPPYIGMIDYTLANRLDFLWMNWPIAAALNSEIGARRYRNRTAALAEYLRAMHQACSEMHRVLKPGSFAALVVGASRRHPQAIEGLVDVFRQRFDLCWGPTPRTPTRLRIAERKGSAPSEYIIVFRR